MQLNTSAWNRCTNWKIHGITSSRKYLPDYVPEYFGGYLNETWHAFIVYMFRRRPEVLHSVGDNALVSGFGKGPIQIHFVSNTNNTPLTYVHYRCVPGESTDEKSIRSRCPQAINHQPNRVIDIQWWRRSMTPNGVTLPQWSVCRIFPTQPNC